MDRDTLYAIFGMASSAAMGFFIMHSVFWYEPKPTRQMLLTFFISVLAATAVRHITRDAVAEKVADIALFVSLGCLVRTILQFFV